MRFEKVFQNCEQNAVGVMHCSGALQVTEMHCESRLNFYFMQCLRKTKNCETRPGTLCNFLRNLS